MKPSRLWQAGALVISALLIVFGFQNCSQVNFKDDPVTEPEVEVAGETESPKTCTFNGTVLADGQSVRAYFTSSVPAGSSCQEQTRLCRNGVLSGSYKFSSCYVEAEEPVGGGPSGRWSFVPGSSSGSEDSRCHGFIITSYGVTCEVGKTYQAAYPAKPPSHNSDVTCSYICVPR